MVFERAPHELRRLCLSVLEQRVSTRSARRSVLVAAAERCLIDLGTSLAMLLGNEGYRALVERALWLTATEFPALADARARSRPPGRVVGLQRSLRAMPSEEIKEVLALTLANVVWILTKLVGTDVCLNLLRQVWPNIAAADLEQPLGDAAEIVQVCGIDQHGMA